MSATTPIVRLFCACELCERKPSGRLIIHNVFYQARPLAGQTYPFAVSQMDFYALLSNGRGKRHFALKFFRGTLGVDADDVDPRFPTIPLRQGQPYDFGENPLAIHELAFHLENVPFSKPGIYGFRLYCEGDPVDPEGKLDVFEIRLEEPDS